MTAKPSTSGSPVSTIIRTRVYSLWAACLLTGCGLAALALAGCSGGGTEAAAGGLARRIA